jgi:hypothetical protein
MNHYFYTFSALCIVALLLFCVAVAPYAGIAFIVLAISIVLLTPDRRTR